MSKPKTANSPRAVCHPERPNEAHGLCRPCYQRRPEYRAREVAYQKRRKTSHPFQTWKTRKTQELKRYGLTLDQYEEMFVRQDGKCAICQTDSSEFNKLLAVDHNHKTNIVRELLCTRCNTAVSVAEDLGSEVLLHVLTYLQRHS